MFLVTSLVEPGAGSQDFPDFCRREFPRLVGTLTLYLGANEAAEELAQEALVRAYQRWRRVSQLDNPGGWVHHVALNLARSYWRRSRAEKRARTANTPTGSTTDNIDSFIEAAGLRTEVRNLPQKERTAVILRFFVGMSVDEVSEVTGYPAGTVKRLTHNGIKRLRESGLVHELEEESHVSH